jgi:hypothetical protein
MSGRILCALFFALPALLAGAPSAGAKPGSVARLIPGRAPVVFVVNDPGRFAESMRGYFPAAADESHPNRENESVAALFRMLGFGGIPAGIDLNGQFAAAIPQFPFPLFLVPVSDYDLFLGGLRKEAGAPAAGSPPPSPVAGLDSVIVAGKPLFARREGSHALLSPLPTLLAPPAAEASLLGLLAGSDLFFRLDVGLTLGLVEPFIEQYRAGMKEAAAKTPSPGQNQADAQRLIQAELDLLLKGIRQVRAFCTGGKAGAEGFSVSTLYLPQRSSGFETLLRGLSSDRHPLLGFFDDDAALAGAIRFDPSALAGLAEAVTDFMFTSGVYDVTAADREEWRRLMGEGLALAGSQSAYYFGPSKSGGAFSTLFMSEIKETEKARSLMRESVALTERLVAAAPGQPEMRVELEPGTHEHDGVDIDRFRITVKPPGNGEEDAKYRETMKALFGGEEFEVWVAFFDDLMVASYYTNSPDELKEMIDRLRSRKGGGLPASTPFRSATASLPRESMSLFFFSFPRFIALVLDMAGRIHPDETLPPWPLSEEQLSGIGSSMQSTGSALKVDTFIPEEERANIRAVTDYLRSLGPLRKKQVPGNREESSTLSEEEG